MKLHIVLSLLLLNALFAIAAEKKPGLTQLNPRGLQRGETIQLRLTGSNLVSLTAVKFSNTNLTGTIQESRTNSALIEVRSSSNLPRGAYEVSVANTNGESGM